MTLRKELIYEYVRLYYEKDTRITFRQNYTKMTDLWVSFSNEERASVNKLLTIDQMS